MKQRIVSIEIKDYRAFLKKHEIVLPAGQNLLLYGENGSGKSSLFKGLQAFLNSSVSPINLNTESNMFKEDGESPNIGVKFKNFEDDTVSSHFINEVKGVDFIEKANLSKAFFGYAEILEVHSAGRLASGHFYALLTLLKDYKYGGKDQKINDMWDGIKTESEKRWSQAHEGRINGWLITFDTAMQELRKTLTDKIQTILNYFDNHLKIEFDYQLATYGRYQKLKAPNIKIRVSYFNRTLDEAYIELLNEARLSSLALSLYLASLQTRPTEASLYKILFLDDALIGLDSGNRIPLLKILHEMFADYQVFITTYDRYWYEMAKDWFEKEAMKQQDARSSQWEYYEMYSVLEKDKKYSFPVVLRHDSFTGKANRYMNDPVYPDYAAAANNFRKAAEEILQRWLPEQELKFIKGKNKGETPEFIMLKALIGTGENFLDKIEQSKENLIDLSRYLKVLLNPLSHYNPETPIHKSELLQIEPILVKLESQLKTLKEGNFYQVAGVPGDKKVRFRFELKSGEVGYHFYEMLDFWYFYKDQLSKDNSNDFPVNRFEIYKISKGGIKTSYPGVQKYKSLSEAFGLTVKNLIEKNHIDPLPENFTYRDVMEYLIDVENDTWSSYKDVISNL